jgi:hypothetical protein
LARETAANLPHKAIISVTVKTAPLRSEVPLSGVFSALDVQCFVRGKWIIKITLSYQPFLFFKTKDY